MSELTKIDDRTIYAPDLMLKLSWLWLIAAAFVYHWKYLLGNKENRQPK